MNAVGICPACHKEIIMQAECPNCKFNIEIFEKAKRISIYLYNKGLEEYNNGYILDSISTLEKSFSFYKNNIVARNLLGLIYFQIGEVGMALKHWVISSNMQKEDNPATKYLAEVNKEKNLLEKKNEAIKIYNEALSYARQGNDDIAVIRLLKAISISPELLKAYILLMLCYYKDEETREKAKAYLEKAKQIDKRSCIMRYYTREIGGDTPIRASEIKQVRKETSNKYDNAKTYYKIGSLKISKTFVACFITAIISLIFAFYLGGFDKIAESNSNLSKSNAKYEEELKIANDKLKELEEELDGYKTEEKKVKDRENILKAEQEANNKNYKNAYELIENVNETLLTDELAKKYYALKPLLLKEVAREYYNEGKALFESENYDKALEVLDMSLECTNIEKFSAEVMYYIARVYEKKQENQKAKEMYTRVINEFPGTHTAQQAEYYSNLLNTENTNN